MAKKGGSNKEAQIARQEEQARQAEVRAGTERVNQTFSSFNDDFFTKQRQGYLDFALPQLDDQYGKAQKSLTFALARDGNLNSSTRANQFADLQGVYDTQRTSIADQGQNFANQARSSVEDARAGLITTLNATGDATGAANAAVSRSAALAAPQGYSPIGDAFAAVTGGLASQAALERAAAVGAARPTYDTGLFGTPKTSVRVGR